MQRTARVEDLLTKFSDDAFDTKHTSFLAIIDVSGKTPRVVLPRDRDILRYQEASTFEQGIDATGRTRAHVFSITKSMCGLAWASRLYDKHRHYARTSLHDDIAHKNDTPCNGYMRSQAGWYLSPTRTLCKFIPTIPQTHARFFFTQTTGIHMQEYGAEAALGTMLAAKRRIISDTDTFDGVLVNNFISEVPAPEGKVFHYDNLLTQVAAFMLEDETKATTGNPEYMIRDHVIDEFFPPELKMPEKQYIRDLWATVAAGYTFYSLVGDKVVEYPHVLKNTLVLAGLQMTGCDMVEFGTNMLRNHHGLLLAIYNDVDLRYRFPKTDDDERAGWAYNLFFWIPMFEGDSRRKWIACIGHQGQYILFELVSKMLFVRQHFSKNILTENIDWKHVTPDSAQPYRYAGFAEACKDLLNKIEKTH